MCGIAGLYDPIDPPDEGRLAAMCASMERRGPDDFGCLCRGAVGLGHRRLSIIDLDGGRQPILNEDETLAVICNGEIYDHQRHIDELRAHGHTFRTRSDTEVLLHLYEEHGPDLLPRINGMFAFAIVHLDSGQIFLARDRLGQKPLFFAYTNQRFAFASGPAALAALPWVDLGLDTRSLDAYCEFQCIPAPRTIYRGVHKLAPGHRAFWTTGHLAHERYFSPEVGQEPVGDYRETCNELRKRLNAAVRRRLVADVPLGFFLSGGLDSSLICALAKQFHKGPMHTFSIGFPDPRYDERKFAQLVADDLDTEHHFLQVNPENFDHLQRIVTDFEEPFADSSMLPTWLLSEFTRQHVTVALSGDGADELFGGYYRYRVMHLYERLNRLPMGLRRSLRGAMLKVLPRHTDERTISGRLRRLANVLDVEGLARYRRLVSRYPRELKEETYGRRMRDELDSGDTLVEVELAVNLHEAALVDKVVEHDLRCYLPDDILVKVDRASMGHSLEVRSPFLDPGVVELALGLPYDWKQRGARRKVILAETFGDVLPDVVYRRPKMGFGVPVHAWLRGSWARPARELLLDGQLQGQSLMQRQGLEAMLDRHVAGRADHSYALFALLMLELWLRGQPGGKS